MARPMVVSAPTIECDDQDARFDLDSLLHPSGAYAHPSDVIQDPDLTLSEMRAILSSWAAEACAIEANAAARRPLGRRPVAFDDIADALSEVDRRAATRSWRHPRYRRVLARRRPGVFGRKERARDDRGPTLN